MKKIAMLTCLAISRNCTASVCFRAWNQKSNSFSVYRGEDVSLEAFLHCNGCGSNPVEDPVMIKKLERLLSIGVEAVHFGVCTKKHDEQRSTCPNIQKIMDMLQERGIACVDGSH